MCLIDDRSQPRGFGSMLNELREGLERAGARDEQRRLLQSNPDLSGFTVERSFSYRDELGQRHHVMIGKQNGEMVAVTGSKGGHSVTPLTQSDISVDPHTLKVSFRIGASTLEVGLGSAHSTATLDGQALVSLEGDTPRFTASGGLGLPRELPRRGSWGARGDHGGFEEFSRQTLAMGAEEGRTLPVRSPSGDSGTSPTAPPTSLRRIEDILAGRSGDMQTLAYPSDNAGSSPIGHTPPFAPTEGERSSNVQLLTDAAQAIINSARKNRG